MLPLATSHIVNSHLRNPFNHVYALLNSMPHFKRNNQNRSKIIFVWQKIQNFRALGAPPDPQNTPPFVEVCLPA